MCKITLNDTYSNWNRMTDRLLFFDTEKSITIILVVQWNANNRAWIKERRDYCILTSSVPILSIIINLVTSLISLISINWWPLPFQPLPIVLTCAEKKKCIVIAIITFSFSFFSNCKKNNKYYFSILQFSIVVSICKNILRSKVCHTRSRDV